nr:putative retrotransposon protein [Tanacetum cinerariifolium]
MGYYFYFPPENKVIVSRYGNFLERDLISQMFSGRDNDLEDDHMNTLPSENTSEILVESESLGSPPELIYVCRSERTTHAPNRLCLNIEVEDDEVGDLGELANDKAAMLDPDKVIWHAMDEEMNSMKVMKVWIVVDLPPNAKVVRSFCDASWQCDKDDTKSQTSYVFVVNGGAVGRKIKKQTTIAMHSVQAEYVAALEAAMEAVWIRKFVGDLRVILSINKPINMYCDNSAAIIFANETGIMKGAKHFLRRYHYVREQVETGEINNDGVSDTNDIVRLKNKLTALKNRLKVWRKSVRDDRVQQKREGTIKLEEIDKGFDQGHRSQSDLNKRLDFTKQLLELKKKESMDLAQKAKIIWTLRVMKTRTSTLKASSRKITRINNRFNPTGYEHPITTPKTESDEIIKSGVEELVPILNENEVTSEDKRECDMLVCENSPICDDHSEIFSDSNNDDDISSDDNAFEYIEYVEALLPDPEIVNVEDENVVYQEEEEFDLKEIQDVVLYAEEEISVVMNDNDELECLDPRKEFDVVDDDYFPFMFVIRFFLPYLICSKMFLSFLSAESEDTIFDPEIPSGEIKVHIEVLLVLWGIPITSDEFPLPEDFPTASEERFSLLRKRDATTKKDCTANEDKTPKDDAATGSASEGSAKKKGRTVVVTTEDMQKKRNDTFGGNEVTRKTKKNLLKQQYGNFKAERKETLEQTFNRKLLTSLAPEWLMHPIVWRNRSDLDTMSLDDLYNHLKVYEPEVQKKSNSHNMAFISTAKNSSGNGKVNTASIPTASTQVSPASANVAAASISLDTDIGRRLGKRFTFKVHMWLDLISQRWSALTTVRWDTLLGSAWLLGAKTGDWSYMENEEDNHALVADEEAPIEFALMAKSSSDNEVFDSSLCSKACKKNTDSLNSKITDLSEKLSNSKTMLYHYKLGLSQVEARLVKFKNQEIKFCEKIRGLEFKVESKTNIIENLTNELEMLKKEKEGLDRKLLDDTITDYTRPSSIIESNPNDLQNNSSSGSENGESTSSILSKPEIKFVKAVDSPTIIKTNKDETVRKPSVKYAEMYKKTSNSSNVRGNQRNWNNLKSQQLGKNFLMKNKTCFNCGGFDHLSYDCGKWVDQ